MCSAQGARWSLSYLVCNPIHQSLFTCCRVRVNIPNTSQPTVLDLRISGVTKHHMKCNSSRQSTRPSGGNDANLCRQSPNVFGLCHDLNLNILKALACAIETGIWPPSPVSDVDPNFQNCTAVDAFSWTRLARYAPCIITHSYEGHILVREQIL